MATSAQYINAPIPGTQDQYGADLVTGFSAIPNRHGAASVATATQLMIWSYFRAPKTYTTTQVKVACGAAAAATPTLVRLGLYAVTPTTGALTSLLASTANDTTIFNTLNTVYTRNWQSSFTFVKDTWYAFAVLQVSGTTTAQVMCAPASANDLIIMSSVPKVVASFAGQTDLPASVASGSVGSSNVGPWAEFI